MQSTFNRSHTATLGTFRCCRTLPTRAGRYRRTPPCPASARNPGRCNSLLGGDSRCCAVAAWPVCCPRHPVPSRHSLQHPCHAKVVWAAGLSGLGCERRRGAEHVTETLVSPASYSCPAYHVMCGLIHCGSSTACTCLCASWTWRTTPVGTPRLATPSFRCARRVAIGWVMA